MNDSWTPIVVEEGKRIVGFFAKLRTKKAGGLTGVKAQTTIMAIGLVVFDEGNPRCSLGAPTVAE